MNDLGNGNQTVGGRDMSAAKWNRMMLAPLVKVALAAVHPPQNRVILNLAFSRHLLEDSRVLQSPQEILVELRTDRDAIDMELDRLARYLGESSVLHRQELGFRIHEAALVLADHSPALDGGHTIEPAEAEVLALLRKRLGLSPDSMISAPSVSASREVDPVRWAAGWTDPMVDAAFEVLCGMHEEHEREWRQGIGLLDSVKRLDDMPDSMTKPVCDQGVLVFPPSWSEYRIWLIGDLHGDISALERVLVMAGADRDGMADRTALLFLGDYGDRGPGTLAVWLRLAALKKRHPGQVFLLRGNHEETIPMKLTRADNGRPYNAPWHVPSTSGMESYLMLAMAMHGNLGDVTSVYEQLADMAILPGGVLGIHGSLPPRWKHQDGWSGSEADKEPYAIRTLADLRKPAVRGSLRWTDFIDRDEVDEGWADLSRGGRLYAATADLDHWRGVIGDFRLVHGHTHPQEGARMEDRNRSLALNTSRYTSSRLAVGSLENGKLSIHALG